MKSLSQTPLDSIAQALNSQRLNALRKNIALQYLNLALFMGVGLALAIHQLPIKPSENAVNAIRILTLLNPIAVVLVLLRFYRNRARHFSSSRLAELSQNPVLNPKGKAVQLSDAELCAEMICHDQLLEAKARATASFLGLICFALAAWTSVLQYQIIYVLNTLPALILLGQGIGNWPTNTRLLNLCQLWITQKDASPQS